ncbi:MAG: DUF5103 domain-containing protein [Sphingomonadales bacterium]|nr:DUF5103 domain-containing protein [Sphingomonadales bacterium]
MNFPNWRHRLLCTTSGLLMLNSLSINALSTNLGPDVYQDQIWQKDIHSVRLHTEQDPFGSPVWELGSDNPPLMLRFDDLAGGYQPYTVRLIPCRRDWTASDLFEAQALEGIGQELVQQHRPSFNTLEQYTHYSHPVPSEVLRPKVSGNFAVVVYADQDLQEIVLTRRLLVLENRVSVSALVRRAFATNEQDQAQQIDLELGIGKLLINQPAMDLSFQVMQNGDWSSLRKGPGFPTFLAPQQWTYRGQPELVFLGNNEYRAVDLRTVRAPGRRISKIIRTVDGYQAWVENDQSQASKAHLSQRDLNGRSLIQNFEQRTPHTESEYVWTTFALEPKLNESWSRVYLQGDFGQSACDESMAMEWQEENGLYVKSLYLKQGFYDYRYRTGESLCEAISIEGSHSDTENDYEILVYYHPPAGMAYDRLVGYTKVNSMGQKSR